MKVLKNGQIYKNFNRFINKKQKQIEDIKQLAKI